MEIVTLTNVTCPECGHTVEEEMPTDACQFFYECKKCGAILTPQEGDCCVFCSFTDVSCPPEQLKGA